MTWYFFHAHTTEEESEFDTTYMCLYFMDFNHIQYIFKIKAPFHIYCARNKGDASNIYYESQPPKIKEKYWLRISNKS